MKKFIPSILCAMVLCLSVVTFGACGETTYAYSELQNEIQQFIEQNKANESSSESLFDSNGYISIKYNNSKLVEAINDTSLNGKTLMYTRLTSNLNSNQAIFEPALKASWMYVANYVSITPANNVPADASTQLYNEFLSLKDKADVFKSNIRKFNIFGEDDFDAQGGIEKSFLSSLLDSYYDFLVASCEFSLNFIDVCNQYVWVDVPDSSSGRIGTGKIERFILERLTENANLYTKGYLSTFYNQTLVSGTDEYFTSQNYSGVLNDFLQTYLTYEVALSDFEMKYEAGEMTIPEQNVVNAYRNAIEYQKLYNVGLDTFNYCIERTGDMTANLDEEFDANSTEQAYKEIVSHFLSNEYENMANYTTTILDCVSRL